jgi:hypothetical protein
MKARVRKAAWLLVLLTASCVPPPQAAPTVELADPNVSEGGEHSESPASVDPAGAIEPNAGAGVIDHAGAAAPGSSAEDRDFVQSRAPRELTPQEVQALPIHLNEEWWPFRAKSLHLSVAQAKQRDAAISMQRAPADFWDEQIAVEAVSVWSVLCNECHGGRRTLQDALTMPVPPPAWGDGEGLFFGNRRSFRHVFDIVYNGGPAQNGVRSEMIAWKKELSKEQIWALLYFLEYQSGGIEGRFPPSLYPRRTETPDSP